MFSLFLIHTLMLFSFQATEEMKPAVVPFEIIGSKHMAVQIKINGKGPYRVIFDTGAPISLLTNKAAQESGLIKKPKSSGKDSSSSKAGSTNFFATMGGMQKIKDLEVGEVKVKDVQVIVMDHPTVKAIAEIVGPVEGIMGFPFFAKFHTTVNYQNKTLTLVPSTYDPGDVMAGLMASMMASNKDKKVFLAPQAVWGFTVGKEAKDTEEGIEVVHVFPNSEAEKAGVKPGDRLLTLDGTWTDTLTDCYRAASQVKAGRAAPIQVRRDGKELKLTVTPRQGW